MPKLHRSNRIVHGMWIGPKLSRLELLTLRSFTQAGHEFHLWRYQRLDQPLPKQVVLRDAREILPENAIFRNEAADPASGVGLGSVGAFSDLFRYKLLHDEGGIWVDMDVTCLRAFEITCEYLFRSHRIGAVGNMMKCPKHSPVMRDAYAQAAAEIGSGSAWMAANQILNEQIAAHKLTSFIRDDFCNPDDWRNQVAPMVWEFRQPPRQWHAIHWLHEYWRGLQDGRITEHGPAAPPVPDKDAPPPGGLLHELYRFHGLIDPHERMKAAPECQPSVNRIPGRALPAAMLQPGEPVLHVNMLIPHLARGGAERIVLEVASAFARTDTTASARVYVQAAVSRQYRIGPMLAPNVKFLGQGKTGWDARQVALEVLGSPTPVLFTHLITSRDLAELWEWGVVTVPVVHNSRPGWLEDPAVYAHENVPFVVAVSEAIAAELRTACSKPVIALRHELQRCFEPGTMTRERKRLRDRHGIGPETLLIGMVGQFKSQKAYTRAVRVLAAMRGICDVRLMILGGWDHDYGGGRTAYEATCRLAVELGVIADMIMPGDVEAAEPYYAAFDVFLNTSVHEGLSIAILEAAAAGCPMVVADAGGNREVLPENSVLVPEGSDIAAYVRGICTFLAQPPRQLPPAPPAQALLPALWAALARHGIGSPFPSSAKPGGTLFVTGNLHIGGAQRSLVNLLISLPRQMKTALCVLGGASQSGFLRMLEDSGVATMFLEKSGDFLARSLQIAEAADRLNFRNICFWNMPPEVKLALSKILQLRDTRLIDVSPGPMLFDALDKAARTQRRLAFDTRAYFSRLDMFVAKYETGIPASNTGPPLNRVAVIPNGVPEPPQFIALPPPEHMLPARFDPLLAVGTCCRLVPDKQLGFLIEMMKRVVMAAPRASLTIVGGPEGEDCPYYAGILQQIADENLDFIRLVGRQEDVNPYLATFRLFVMVSDRQGCPNASLEAMAMGLPVISNRSGGVEEQVQDGVTGYLVDTPAEMAARVAAMLRRPAQLLQFGEAGRARARARFSMPQMVRRYQALLADQANLRPLDFA